MPKTETFDRDSVLNSAISVFNKKGYNGTSMQDLVEATGLNRSSIYNSFNSKHGLYLECLKVYESQSNQNLTKVLLKSQDPENAIKGLLRSFVNAIAADRDGKGCLIGNCKSEMANTDHTITMFLENNQSKTLELFSSIIENGQELGQFNKHKSASELALYLYTAVQGFRMTGILVKKREELETIAELIIKSLK